MNSRIDRLNKLMRDRAFFVDPVGLSDDQNDKDWDIIINNDKHKASLVRKMTEGIKNGDMEQYEKIRSEYNQCDANTIEANNKIRYGKCEDEVTISNQINEMLKLLRRIAKKGEFMDREGLRLVVEDWLNRRDLMNDK